MKQKKEKKYRWHLQKSTKGRDNYKESSGGGKNQQELAELEFGKEWSSAAGWGVEKPRGTCKGEEERSETAGIKREEV